MANGSL